jgi:hypothetical protein
MKKMICIYGIVLAVLLCNGCADRIPIIQDGQEQTTENEKYGIGLSGVQHYEDDTFLDSDGQVALIAMVEADAKIDNKKLIELNILSSDETSVIIQYTLELEEQNYEEPVDVPYEYHVVRFDKNTNEKKELTFVESYLMIKGLKECISIEKYDGENTIIESYNYNLEPIGSVTISSQYSGNLTTDGKRYYYVENGLVCCSDMLKNTSHSIEMDSYFLAENMIGVITDNGKDYVVVNGIAKDYKNYQFIFDVENHEIFRVNDMVEMYAEVDKDIYVEKKWGEMYIEYWLVGESLETAKEYHCSNVNEETYLYTMNSGHLCFVDENKKSVALTIYQHKDSKQINYTNLNFEQYIPELKEEDMPEEMYGGAEIYLHGEPVYLDDKTILLQFIDIKGNRYFALWTVEVKKNTENDLITVQDHLMGSCPSVDIFAFEGVLLRPGEVSDELRPLKEKADQLEDKYDVEIYIGEECADLMGGYAVHPLNDYALLEEALHSLDEAMSRYPDNFFSQFEYSWYEDGLSIYLASELKGIEDGVLGTAGGFQFERNAETSLVLDCNNIYGMTSTFHHELSHAIEDKITYVESTESKVILKAEDWEAMNTYPDMYTYSYEDSYNEAYDEVIYQYMYYSDADVSNTCFVDSYALSYPSEDRSRIFESVMCDYYEVDFDKAPRIKAKLNYYADAIREVFDTTGWEDVPWEVYQE